MVEYPQERKKGGEGGEREGEEEEARQVILNEKMDPSIFIPSAPLLQSIGKRPLARMETGSDATAGLHDTGKLT